MTKQPFLNATEAANLRGCSRQYIHKLIRSDRIPGVIRAGSNYALIPRTEGGGYIELDKHGLEVEITEE